MPYFAYGDSRIYYEERGTGDPVLVMPGFTDGIEEVEGLVAALSGRYRVIGAELPGSGRSFPQPRLYNPDFYTQDAHSMAALLQHVDAIPAHVAGFSDGGEVALLMAILHPGAVRSLVVWGAGGALPEEIRPLLKQIGTVVDNPVGDMASWSDYLKRAYGEETARSMMQSWADASCAIIDAGGDISLSRVGEIGCPALIIHGELDPYCTPAMARNLASRIARSTVAAAAGVGHNVHSMRPEWFNSQVLDWLARQE